MGPQVQSFLEFLYSRHSLNPNEYLFFSKKIIFKNKFTIAPNSTQTCHPTSFFLLNFTCVNSDMYGKFRKLKFNFESSRKVAKRSPLSQSISPIRTLKKFQTDLTEAFAVGLPRVQHSPLKMPIKSRNHKCSLLQPQSVHEIFDLQLIKSNRMQF